MIPNFKLCDEKLYRLNLVADMLIQFSKAGLDKTKFIDLGCKDGYLLDKAEEFGYEAHGVDIENNIIDILNKHGYNVKKADLNKALPYENNSFDIISCQQVIEHLTDPENLIKEGYRILKKDGILILSTPNLASFGSRLRLLFNKYPLQLGPCNKWHFGNHYRLFTLPTLKCVLERNGFRVDKTIGTEIYFNPNAWLKGWNSKLLAKLFPSLAQRVIVVCRK